MSKDPRLYLSSILESIKKIKLYAASLTFDQFMSNSMAQDAIIRNLGVIERAYSCLPEEMREQHTDVSWHSSIGEYYCVNLNIVWETIQKDLPTLGLQIEKILEEL